MKNINNNHLFRANALNHLQKLEDDFKLFTVVTVSAWCWLLWIVLCIAALLFWAFFGRINIYLDGQGILISAGSKPISILARHSGIVSEVYVKPKMRVEKGCLLAKIKNLYLATELKFVKQAYVAKTKQYEKIKQNMSVLVKEIIRKYFINHRYLLNNIGIELEHFRSAKLLYKKKYRLFKRHYITIPVIDEAKNEYINADKQIGMLKQKIYENQLNCKAALKDIMDTQEKITTEYQQAKQLFQMKKIIFDQATNIRSDEAGIINSINIKTGEHIDSGAQLFTLLTQPSNKNMEALIFLHHTNDQKAAPNMQVKIYINETNFNNNYRLGRIVDVSEYPANKNFVNSLLGNTNLVDEYFMQGVPYLARVTISNDKGQNDNLLWHTTASHGACAFMPGAKISAKIITREVSPFRLLQKLVNIE